MQQQLNILVVDSEARRRDLCRRLLEPEACAITEALPGRAALAKIGERRPDLIIVCDLASNTDALECTRCLKTDPATRDIPILVAVHTEAEVAEGLEAGADDYIIAPLRREDLVLRVRSLPTLCRQKAELFHNRDMLGEHARAMTVLLDFSQRLAIASDLAAVLEETVTMTAQLACSRRVSVMLLDQEDDCLTIAESLGIDDDLVSKVRVPVGSATAGRVFLTGESVVINAPGQGGRNGYDSQFFVSTPLVSKALSTPEHVVGVLNITERQGGRPFTSLDLEYIDLISNMAAAMIDDLVTRQARDQSRDSIAVALAKLAEYRDSDTGMHLDRVTKFALILTEELRETEQSRAEIDGRFTSQLERAVPLHDIGKVAIPDHILLKPGRLTPHETKLMQKHAAVGAETIRLVIKRTPGSSFLKMAEEIAFSHHEWYDGSGYPRGLSGTDIPLAARITALADVYDAVTTKRPYKDPMPHEQAVEIIRSANGSQFDPAIVEAFLRRERAFAQVAAQLADQAVAPAAVPCSPVFAPLPATSTGT